MLFGRRQAKRGARIPTGQRVYAIGDVHGRLDLLDLLLAEIEADDRARAPAQTMLVQLGDLVDRGPDSAGAVRRMRALAAEGRWDVRLIMGNHEELLHLATTGDSRSTRLFLQQGGRETLHSYGLSDEEIGHGSYQDLARLLRARIPAEDLDYLRAGEDMVIVGDYAFTHAGVRPGVPLDRQSPSDLRWIRSEFLSSTRDHGKVVVHGHTPVSTPESRDNRIGIDTGAFATGCLTAVCLEEGERRFLSTAGAASAAAA